jgi:hypothetical protein
MNRSGQGGGSGGGGRGRGGRGVPWPGRQSASGFHISITSATIVIVQPIPVSLEVSCRWGEGQVATEAQTRHDERPKVDSHAHPAWRHLDPHCCPVYSKPVQIGLFWSESVKVWDQTVHTLVKVRWDNWRVLDKRISEQIMEIQQDTNLVDRIKENYKRILNKDTCTY